MHNLSLVYFIKKTSTCFRRIYSPSSRGTPLFSWLGPTRKTDSHLKRTISTDCCILVHTVYILMMFSRYTRNMWRFFEEIYLLTHSMVQSLSWEANRFAASQEIPRISRNPKVHYRTHKRPPSISIQGQPNPVHITTSHLLDIHHIIIHPSTPRSEEIYWR